MLELEEKMVRLLDFLDDGVKTAKLRNIDIYLLQEQFICMHKYSAILHKRLKIWEDEQ